MEFTGYKIERMLPMQWGLYQEIRLEALKEDRGVFGSSYEKEVLYTEEKWISLLENESRAIFALYYENIIIGLTGVILRPGNEQTAVLFSTYIKKAHRGKGLSKLFYRKRIDWAIEKKCTTIVVSHRIGNESSKAANQKFGFKYQYSEEILWPDGSLGDELIYQLQL